MADDKILTEEEEEEEIVVDPNNPESSVVGVTAQPISGIPITSGPEQSEADWYAAQGLDPDKDYNEAKAALEYDYETSMATYGRRAEELYQMGLSNSGVSDIYQLGAFNAYLAAQSDLAYQRIEAKKKNKQAYLAYDKEYQAGVKADTANAYNLGLSIYDGTNIDFVRQQLGMQGYDASVVESAIASLSSLDAATLPVVKAQAEQDNSDISTAVSTWGNKYTSSQYQTVHDYYAAQGWSEEKIQRLMDQLKPFGEMNHSTKMDSLYSSYVNTYDPSQASAIVADLQNQNISEKDINELMRKLNTAYNSRPIADRVNAIYGKLDLSAYNGKEDGDTALKEQIANLGYTDEAEINAVIDKARTTFNNNVQNEVDSYYDWAYNNYNGENEWDVRSALSQYVSSAGIDAIMEQVKAADISGSSAYKDKREKEVAEATTYAQAYYMGETKNTGKSSGGGSKFKGADGNVIDKNSTYVPDSSNVAKKLRDMGYSEDVIKEAVKWIDNLSSDELSQLVNNKVGPEVEEMNNLIASTYGTSYSGTHAQNNTIRTALQRKGYDTKFIDQVINTMTNDYTRAQKAQAADLVAALDDNNDAAFRNAYSLVGKTKDEWNAMDDEDKTLALLVGMGDMMKNGYISSADVAAIVNEWYDGTLEEISTMPQGEQPEKIDEFMNQIDTLADRGAISEETRKAWKETLQKEKSAIVDANIRGVVHEFGMATIFTSVGPIGWVLGAAHYGAKAVKTYVEGE